MEPLSPGDVTKGQGAAPFSPERKAQRCSGPSPTLSPTLSPRPDAVSQDLQWLEPGVGVRFHLHNFDAGAGVVIPLRPSLLTCE